MNIIYMGWLEKLLSIAFHLENPDAEILHVYRRLPKDKGWDMSSEMYSNKTCPTLKYVERTRRTNVPPFFFFRRSILGS